MLHSIILTASEILIFESLIFVSVAIGRFLSDLLANPRVVFLMTQRIYPQVGFVFAMAVDDGATTVIRMTRLSPEYQGRYLHRLMSRHVSIRQVMYKGAKTVVSTEEDVGPHKNSVLPRYTEKAFNSWVGIVALQFLGTIGAPVILS